MIIEFFGPPSAGKTTLALMLANQLRARGYKVAEHFSLRPAEQRAIPTGGETHTWSLVGPVLSRVGRPFGQMLRTVGPLSRVELQVLQDFLGTLPPRSFLWSLRLSQYLLRLEAEWSAAARADEIALFDQAYIQFICSLGLLSTLRESTRLARLLLICAEPDMLILVDAPRETLENRLQERMRRQSIFERLFEFDMKMNLASIGVIGEIAELLAQQGRSFTRVSSVDSTAAQTILESIALQLPRPRFGIPVAQTLSSIPMKAYD
jgi:RecA/RadA recombinase